MLEKIILTDMDKTLVDVHDQLTGSIAKTLAFFKKEYDFNILNTTNHLYDYLGSLGIDIDDRNFWGKLDNFENREEGIKSKRVKLFPYTKEFLEFLKDKKAAIVSDTPPWKANIEIKAFELDKYIKVFSLWDPSNIGKGKPHPLLALQALEKLESNGSELVYFVGDDQVDIDCGHNLEKETGMQVVKVHINRNKNGAKGADFIVSDLRQAKEIIEGIYFLRYS